MQKVRYGVQGFFSANLPGGQMLELQFGMNDVADAKWAAAQKVPALAEYFDLDIIKQPGVSATMARVMRAYTPKPVGGRYWPEVYIENGMQVETSKYTVDALFRNGLIDTEGGLTKKGSRLLAQLRK